MVLDAPTRESLIRFLTDIVGAASATDGVARWEFDVNDLATRDDIAATRSDVAALDSTVAALDSTVASLDVNVAALDAKIDLVRHELIGVFRGELLAAVTSQTRSMLIGIVSTSVVFAAAVLGAVQLG